MDFSVHNNFTRWRESAKEEGGRGERRSITEDDRWCRKAERKGENKLGKLQSGAKHYVESRGPFETAG